MTGFAGANIVHVPCGLQLTHVLSILISSITVFKARTAPSRKPVRFWLYLEQSWPNRAPLDVSNLLRLKLQSSRSCMGNWETGKLHLESFMVCLERKGFCYSFLSLASWRPDPKPFQTAQDEIERSTGTRRLACGRFKCVISKPSLSRQWRNGKNGKNQVQKFPYQRAMCTMRILSADFAGWNQVAALPLWSPWRPGGSGVSSPCPEFIDWSQPEILW